LKAAQADLQLHGATQDASIAVVKADVERLVREVQASATTLRAADSELRRLDSRAKLTHDNITELRALFQECEQAVSQFDDTLRQQVAQIAADQQAYALTIARLDERISARARKASLERVERNLGARLDGIQQQRASDDSLLARIQELEAKLQAQERQLETRFQQQHAQFGMPGAAASAQALAPQPAQPESGMVPVLATLAALIANKKEPEHAPRTTFAAHDPASYTYFLQDNTLPVLEGQLRMEFDVRPSGRGASEFAMFWAWVTATYGETDEPVISPASLALGKSLLRACRIAAAGANPTTIATALAKQDFGDDSLGLALAQSRRLTYDKSKKAIKTKCWFCGAMGHSAKTCSQRIAEGAPVPTSDISTSAKASPRKSPRKNGKGQQ
jgi:predicted  nucleic acid-binding Zn-ribbon protein